VVLLWQSRPWPMDFTRIVAVGGRKLAVIQGVGPGPAGGGMTIAQPATMKGTADMGTGVPMILTRGFGAAGFAWPP
jgi:hypothetical protein